MSCSPGGTLCTRGATPQCSARACPATKGRRPRSALWTWPQGRSSRCPPPRLPPLGSEGSLTSTDLHQHLRYAVYHVAANLHPLDCLPPQPSRQESGSSHFCTLSPWPEPSTAHEGAKMNGCGGVGGRAKAWCLSAQSRRQLPNHMAWRCRSPGVSCAVRLQSCLSLGGRKALVTGGRHQSQGWQSGERATRTERVRQQAAGTSHCWGVRTPQMRPQWRRHKASPPQGHRESRSQSGDARSAPAPSLVASRAPWSLENSRQNIKARLRLLCQEFSGLPPWKLCFSPLAQLQTQANVDGWTPRNLRAHWRAPLRLGSPRSPEGSPCARHSFSHAASQSGGGVMRMTLLSGTSTDLRYCTMLRKFAAYSSSGMCCLGFSSVGGTQTLQFQWQ